MLQQPITCLCLALLGVPSPCSAQERDLGPVALGSDPAWTHLVLTRENGQVLRIPRGDIASLHYLAGKPEEVNLAGEWLALAPASTVPLRYRVSQEGTSFLWTCHVRDEQGHGSLCGRDLEGSFKGDEGSGTLKGRVLEVDARGHATAIHWAEGTTWTRMSPAQAREFVNLAGTWLAADGTEQRFTQEGANLYWFTPKTGERGRATVQGWAFTGIGKMGQRTLPVAGQARGEGGREPVSITWKDGEVLLRKPGSPRI